MEQLVGSVKSWLAKKNDYLRRRRHAVKTYAFTRNHGVVVYYDTIAIPQTLEKELYDVRIKRYRPRGRNVEIIEDVWARGKVLKHAHMCFSQNPWCLC